MTRFFAYHSGLVQLIFTLPLSALLLIVLLMNGFSIIVWFLLTLMMLFIVLSSSIYCMHMITRQKLLQLVNECDPYPLLTEMTNLFSRTKTNSNDTFLQMCLSSALSNTGDFRQAISVLHTIELAKYSTKTPYNKALVYFSLSELYTLINEADQAVAYFEMANNVSAHVTRSEMKVQLKKISAGVGTAIQIMQGNFDAAEMMIAENIDYYQYNSSKVTLNYLLAAIYRGQGKMHEAVQSLQDVIDHGNKLFVVTLAQKMLEEINREEGT